MGGGGGGEKKKREKEKPCWCLKSQPLVLDLHFLVGVFPDTHSKGYGHVGLCHNVVHRNLPRKFELIQSIGSRAVAQTDTHTIIQPISILIGWRILKAVR